MSGRNTKGAPERPRKVVGVAESQLIRNLLDLQVGGLDLLSRPIEPQVLQVPEGPLAPETLKEPAQIRLVDPAGARHILQAMDREVVFLDELPEYQRGALEALRQPLESGRATVARAS